MVLVSNLNLEYYTFFLLLFFKEAASGGKASAMVGAATSQYAAYASFPVDVIVYFRMQPSIVRFSCLPVSRVECLLRLPSVDLVFSSKRAEDEPFPLEGTPSETAKTPGAKGLYFGIAASENLIEFLEI